MRVGMSPLLVDLYQLNMMESYLESGETEQAVFEFFVRKLPERRSFLIAAGLEQALDYLETLRFSKDDIDWLRSTGEFTQRFLDYLAAFRFRGHVHAMEEGTPFFAEEPILRVTAPLPEAQFVETRLINLLHFQSLIASKASRIVLAASGKLLVDFGLRRAHGSEAGILAARASYIAGFAGTATVLAKKMFSIPTYGTMAHSLVEAHDDEVVAFEDFARARPDNLTLLLDTYDTENAARKLIELAPRLAASSITIQAVRLDSGDLATTSRNVRRILDGGGLKGVKVFVSGGLDEDSIAALIRDAAPIDGFGVGTSLTTSSDVPALDCTYKLQEYKALPRRKRSEGKATWPGRKQVWRRSDPDRAMVEDVLSSEDDQHPGEPLITQVMKNGVRIGPKSTLEEIRNRTARELARMPAQLLRLGPGPAYPVIVADSLRRLANEADRLHAPQRQAGSGSRP